MGEKMHYYVKNGKYKKQLGKNGKIKNATKQQYLDYLERQRNKSKSKSKSVSAASKSKSKSKSVSASPKAASCAGNRPPCPKSCDRVVRTVKAPGKEGRDGKKVKRAHCRARSAKLAAWVKAAKQHGYLKKGENFKKMPKKGTDAYKAIKATYDKMKK